MVSHLTFRSPRRKHWRSFCQSLVVLDVQIIYVGTWCSGITSVSHAEGPGFNPQCVHLMRAGGQRDERWRSHRVCQVQHFEDPAARRAQSVERRGLDLVVACSRYTINCIHDSHAFFQSRLKRTKSAKETMCAVVGHHVSRSKYFPLPFDACPESFKFSNLRRARCVGINVRTHLNVLDFNFQHLYVLVG